MQNSIYIFCCKNWNYSNMSPTFISNSILINKLYFGAVLVSEAVENYIFIFIENFGVQRIKKDQVTRCGLLDPCLRIT